MDLRFEIQIKVQKPAMEVFDAIVDPKKLCSYFTATASARLETGTVVHWSFDEAPEPFPVRVLDVVLNERIVFEWPSALAGASTRVEIELKPISSHQTRLVIWESGWSENQEGLDASYGNCGGWMHMACSLKAFLEHGINLRAGGVR